MTSDPSRLIAALALDRFNLDLKTLDLCFLASLYLRADRASIESKGGDGTEAVSGPQRQRSRIASRTWHERLAGTALPNSGRSRILGHGYAEELRDGGWYALASRTSQ